jgi:hypothetical protein
MEKKNKGYTEDGVLQDLKRKSDLRVQGKYIYQLKEGKGDVGHGTKGKIDFLTKYCGYIHLMVKEFKK